MNYWQIDHPVFIQGSGHESFFVSEEMQKSLSRIMAYLRRTPSVHFITGEPGVGKTQMAKWCTNQFSPQIWDICYLHVSQNIDKEKWLIKKLAKYFGVHYGLKDEHLILEVGRHLDMLVEEKRKLVTIIDGADRISGEKSFTELETLLQIQDVGSHCLSFVMVGRDPLRQNIQQHQGLQSKLGCQHEVMDWSYPEIVKFINHSIDQHKNLQLEIPEEVSSAIYSHYRGRIGPIVSALENILIECFLAGSRDIKKIFRENKSIFILPFASSSKKQSNDKTKGDNDRLFSKMTTRLDSKDSHEKIKRDHTTDDENISLNSLFKKNA